MHISNVIIYFFLFKIKHAHEIRTKLNYFQNYNNLDKRKYRLTLQYYIFLLSYMKYTPTFKDRTRLLSKSYHDKIFNPI